MNAYGHNFTNHKSEEMICWACGFVIWRCDDIAAIERAVRDIGGRPIRYCGKQWHRTVSKNGRVIK